MEQATSSPYVANVFVACGTSQVLEYSSKGSLHDLVKISRLAEQDPMKPLDKLKVLIHIASALADLHDKGAVHGDLCIDQFLFLDGVYKLNDFHMSLFVQQQDDNDQICFERNHFSSGVSTVVVQNIKCAGCSSLWLTILYDDWSTVAFRIIYIMHPKKKTRLQLICTKLMYS